MPDASARAPSARAPSARAPLEIAGLEAWYGPSQALYGVALSVGAGELVTLLGRNGAGKTTTLNAIVGMVPRRKGSIRIEGIETGAMPSHKIARTGVAICPEDRGIYATLTAEENLVLPPVVAEGGLSVDEILVLFPGLKDRLKSPGTKLSGGEQQMLAIGRILRTGARLLLLDEPTEGLAPVVVKQIGAAIADLKRRGYTILMVEQNVRFASTIADRHYVVDRGRIAETFDNATLLADFDRISGRLSA
ncbi:ABC transporter ATP-binding protein [Salinarimonas ramus]|uniref:ABC transporter ATP-binding protein n=1 Tax=Salinarimonas ramus TaxID=690164 RepID=A0A917Q427_9HYPH|nr:ABC transporter ATP-binding protein [Salinarimonas ramus]GGK20944.1 ABC transporter ATP-binding protein [Salinarimonas ramus]